MKNAVDHQRHRGADERVADDCQRDRVDSGQPKRVAPPDGTRVGTGRVLVDRVNPISAL